MYVVVLAYKCHNKLVELRVNPFDKEVGLNTSRDCMMKNKGEGTHFSLGPTCNYCGKEMPYLYDWSEKESMIAKMWENIIKTLGLLEIVSCLTDINPVLLLDGHGSRFGLIFLSYVNDPAYLWFAMINVSYGSSM